MTYADLIAEVAGQARLTKKSTRELLSAAFDAIGTEAAKGRLEIPGFGVFLLRRRKSRAISNPLTKERMRLPASRTVGFRAAKELRAKAAVR